MPEPNGSGFDDGTGFPKGSCWGLSLICWTFRHALDHCGSSSQYRNRRRVQELVMTVTQTVSKPVVQQKFPIESLLSARLMMAPKVAGDKVYFLSDLNGSLSLYSMEKSGGIPSPLLPPGQALVNPHLINGENF